MRLNECYSVPDHIMRQIRNLDPDVRLRWDKQRCKVRVERKVWHSIPLDPQYWPNQADFEMARDGYAPWLTFLPSEDNYHKLIYTMKVMDLWRLGGANAVADQIEADEAREKAHLRDSWKSDIHMMAAEMFRHLNTPRTGWKPYEVKAE